MLYVINVKPFKRLVWRLHSDVMLKSRRGARIPKHVCFISRPSGPDGRKPNFGKSTCLIHYLTAAPRLGVGVISQLSVPPSARLKSYP